MEVISWYYNNYDRILCVEPFGHGGDILVI